MTSKEYLTNRQILSKYFELMPFQLQLLKIRCQFIEKSAFFIEALSTDIHCSELELPGYRTQSYVFAALRFISQTCCCISSLSIVTSLLC